MPEVLALPLRRFQPQRYRPGNLGTWSGHLSFANDLIWASKPKVLVELGTHFGESYFGFCQAVQESGATTRCFAVDTWQGDEHAGFYGEDVYRDVEGYNQSRYQPFSTLVRDTFDSASGQFDPESIDLLHIDGLHTYQAVKHDFEIWFGKVKPGGVVLLHDINVRHSDFEVWRFWEELSQQFAHFEFRHCWGLGILRKAGGEPYCELLQLLFEADSVTAERIRTQYSDGAELMELRERHPDRTQAAAESGRPYLQVFAGMPETGFEEKHSALSNVEEGVWKRHVLRLPQGLPTGLIRIDPVNRWGLVEISEITIRELNGQEVNKIQLPRDLAKVWCAGQILHIGSGEAARFFCWGDDPQLTLQLIPNASPLQFEISLLVQFKLEPLGSLISAWQQQRGELENRLSRMQIQLSREDHRVTRMEWDLAFLRTQLDSLKAENARLKGTHITRTDVPVT